MSPRPIITVPFTARGGRVFVELDERVLNETGLVIGEPLMVTVENGDIIYRRSEKDATRSHEQEPGHVV